MALNPSSLRSAFSGVHKQNRYQMHPLLSVRHKNAHEGELRMWRACIKDAVRCARGRVSHYKCQTDRDEETRKARRWFASSRVNVGSFLWVCSILELNPEDIRAAVRGKKQ